ncbi:hypothetical protein BC829DRAFT_396748 [Chytridium lagenaria]|nr:hypothetical protein BC829DRAFT_396748 [Chytridium lagenaria]
MPPVGSFMQSSGDRRASTGMAGAAVSQGKKGAKRTAPGTSGAPPSSSSAIGAGLPPNKKRAKSGATVQGSSTSNASAGAAASSQASLPRPETIEELEWIDRCKRTIGNKATYHEFLKVLNLFSHGYIDAKTLVECVEPFLSRAPELFEWFKKFVKFDEDVVITNTPAELGHSYRLLPPSVPRSACSGETISPRVLNDDWISQPEYVSETGFVAHKKTQYEEALHKCEEERYEFDINIEANLHTIARLLSQHKGQEVIDALYNSPAIAVPVVLKRLKQKDEEWKRAQRDWNKIWREIDAKNYYKALDHQGITFKASDRKTMSAKALASEIENIYREQRERKALLTTQAATPAGLKDSVPLTRYQIEFRYKDLEIFTDVRRLIMDQVTHAQNISQSDEERIEEFLVNFVRRFFCVESVDVVRITPKREDDAESGSGDNEDSGSVANGDDSAMSVTNGENHTNGTGLRKDLLVRRAEAGGLVGVKKEADDDEIMSSTSVDENVAGSSSESKKKEAGKGKPETAVKPGSPRKRRSTFTFYANANFTPFLDFIRFMLYARLVKMKELSQHLAENPPRAETLNSIALLRAIHEMFDSKMDVNEFEDRCRALFGTSGYLMFTVDKLVQTIIRQIQAIQSDPKGHDLVDLYLKDRDKPSTSSRQDAVYRLGAEGLLPEENLYRLEYYVRERALTIQLIVKDDSAVDDTISTEEKWSMYVDHFIQLSTTEGIRLRQRTGPFLRRNLPSRIPDDPPTDVESRSGLELKICLNTYKIFFVENTEDYFFRRRPPVTSTVIESKKNVAEASAARFRSWHEERMKEIEAEAEAEAEAAAAEAAAAVLRKEEATKMAVDEEGAGNALEELTRDLRDVGMNFAKEVAKDGDAMEVDEGAVNPNPVDTAPEEADDKKGKCGETAVDLEKEEGKVADATAMAVDG